MTRKTKRERELRGWKFKKDGRREEQEGGKKRKRGRRRGKGCVMMSLRMLDWEGSFFFAAQVYGRQALRSDASALRK